MNLGFKDFFMGVVHLFVIFLPGAVILLSALYYSASLQQLDDRLDIGGFGIAVLFIGASYFFGHLASLFASWFEDHIYVGARTREFGEQEAALRRIAHEICVSNLGSGLVSPRLLRRWCALLVRQQGGVLQSGIDTKDADRRFYRNIQLVLLFPLALSALQSWNTTPGYRDFGASIVFLILVVLSHFRYRDQDAKFTRLVFESYIALEAGKDRDIAGMQSRATHAGGIVTRDKGTGRYYLLVRPSQEDKSEWVLPKGHVEKSESPEAAAKREVSEEGGVDVKLLAFLDFTRFRVGRKEVLLANYLMEYERQSEREHEHRGQWFKFDQARVKLSYPESRAVLEQAHGLLEGKLMPFFRSARKADRR